MKQLPPAALTARWASKRTRIPAELGEAVALEFANVDYRRVFLLPKGIDTDAIVARMENGVLKVRLPRSAASRPRRIEVVASG